MQLRHLHAVGIALLAVGMLTNVAFAAKDLKAQPFVFAGDCSVPAGDKQHGVAQWDNKVGEKDDNGNANFALRLEKNAPTTECTAAGATIDGAQGQPADVKYGFDYKNGTHCGAGAPRFNLTASDGFHFIGGCANGTASPGSEAGWTRVTFDATNPLQASPVVAPGATIISLELIVDEQGKALVDNIRVGTNDPITKPGR
jgi:hypothetical protein